MRKFSGALDFFALWTMKIYFQEDMEQKWLTMEHGTFELWDIKPYWFMQYSSRGHNEKV
jgi:hypothetical protein